jgi:hypothetical protein
MSALTPDAAYDAYQAISKLTELTNRRFVAYVHRHLSKQKNLVEPMRRMMPAPDSKEAIIPKLVEDCFCKVLRLKVEQGSLPATGPAVVIDDLHRFAGVLVAPFVMDMEAGGMLKPGATELATKWKGQDIGLSPGVFERAVARVLEEICTPAYVVGVIAPIVTVAVASQTCMRFPLTSGSTKSELIRISAQLTAILEMHGLSLEEMLQRDDLLRDLFVRMTDRKDFEKAIDPCQFPLSDARYDELDDAAKKSMGVLIAADAGAAPALGSVSEKLGKLRAEDRIMHIAYADFLRQEAELMWGKPSPLPGV